MVNLDEMHDYRIAEERDAIRRSQFASSGICTLSRITIVKERHNNVSCPHCKSIMFKKYGKYGYFMACSGRYCTYTYSL